MNKREFLRLLALVLLGSNKWPDLPLDFGATWIHGVTGNPITDLADHLGAKRLVTSYERTVIYNTDGQLLSETEESQLERIRKQVFDRLRKAQDSDGMSGLGNEPKRITSSGLKRVLCVLALSGRNQLSTAYCPGFVLVCLIIWLVKTICGVPLH